MSEPSSTPSAPHFALVGKVAASWAMLDLNFDITITMLTSLTPEESACITSQFSSHYPKIKAIITLCELKGVSPKTLKALKKYSGSLSDLTERRNRAIHDAWAIKDGKFIGQISLLDRSDAFPDPVAELTSLLISIKKRIVTFRELRSTFLSEIRSSH